MENVVLLIGRIGCVQGTIRSLGSSISGACVSGLHLPGGMQLKKVELHGVCTTALHVTSSSECGSLSSLLTCLLSNLLLALLWAQGKERALPCILRRVPDAL